MSQKPFLSCGAARQAVRLPKEFRFAADEVFIRRLGSAVVLLPKAKAWDTLIESLAEFPPHFMRERCMYGLGSPTKAGSLA